MAVYIVKGMGMVIVMYTISDLYSTNVSDKPNEAIFCNNYV